MFACLGIVISVNLLHVGEFSFQTFFFSFFTFTRKPSFHRFILFSMLVCWNLLKVSPSCFLLRYVCIKCSNDFWLQLNLWHVYNAILLIKNKHKTTKQSPFEPMSKRSDLSNALQKVAEITHKCLQFTVRYSRLFIFIRVLFRVPGFSRWTFTGNWNHTSSRFTKPQHFNLHRSKVWVPLLSFWDSFEDNESVGSFTSFYQSIFFHGRGIFTWPTKLS